MQILQHASKSDTAFRGFQKLMGLNFTLVNMGCQATFCQGIPQFHAQKGTGGIPSDLEKMILCYLGHKFNIDDTLTGNTKWDKTHHEASREMLDFAYKKVYKSI